MHWFKRKYQQIKRVIDFLPIIWNGFDWDYMYAIELFKHQLKRTEKSLSSETSYGMDSKTRASRIRTAIELMDNVYEEKYGMEWMDELEKRYGKGVLDWDVENEDDEESVSIGYKFEKWSNGHEIHMVKSELAEKSYKKQKKAHKLLWNFIEHNIQWWWD